MNWMSALRGYETVRRSIDLPDVPGFSQSMIIYMKRIDETLIFHPPSGQFALTPKAQKELQNGLKDFQARKFSSGQKHVSKALALDPGNPHGELRRWHPFTASRSIGAAKVSASGRIGPLGSFTSARSRSIPLLFSPLLRLSLGAIRSRSKAAPGSPLTAAKSCTSKLT